MTVRASRGKFSRGSHLENWFPEGDFWCHPPGISVFSGPKNEFRKLPSTPLYKKNGTAHLGTKLDMLFEIQLFYPKILDFMQKHYSVTILLLPLST